MLHMVNRHMDINKHMGNRLQVHMLAIHQLALVEDHSFLHCNTHPSVPL
jgi:hypothetical protein